jgi:hypothetical protein
VNLGITEHPTREDKVVVQKLPVSPERTTADGAFMESSGRNRWQAVANGTASKTAQTNQTVAAGCDRLPENVHGKEGVDGSSPSEGLAQQSLSRRSRLTQIS